MKVNSYRSFLNDQGNPYLEAVQVYKVDGRKAYTPPEAVAEFVCNELRLDRCADEYAYCLCLDAKGHLTGLFEVGHGTVTGSLVSPREVFQKALILGAVSIILTHNHPSGDPTPSEGDIAVTRKVNEAGKLVDIPLTDHVIVGRSGYISMRANKLY
jgi:DNA repair protein RadC